MLSRSRRPAMHDVDICFHRWRRPDVPNREDFPPWSGCREECSVSHQFE